MAPDRPDTYAPPLKWWSSLWRYAVALLIAAVVAPQYVQIHWDGNRTMLWIDAGVGLLAFLLVHQRRRHPAAIGVVTGLLAGVSSMASGPATLAAVSAATTRRWPIVVIVGLAQLLGSHLLTLLVPIDDGIPLWITFAINMVVIAACLGWGMYIGSRRELLWTLRDRAERAEAERDLRSSKARGDERARIAREMHDVLAHRISQVSMHAGALAFREDLTAEQMRSTATILQSQANQALIDLRGVLGVLRDSTTGELLDRPQPTYSDLEALLEESRAAGMHVEYESSMPEDDEVPETVGRTLYRIVQEGLTNARKHAPGTTVFVTISGSREEGFDVVIRNPLGFRPHARTPGAGLGLVGLTERVELIEGTLEHRKDGSMFVLHAWIPWTA